MNKIEEIFGLDRQIATARKNVTGDLFTPNEMKLRNLIRERNGRIKWKLAIVTVIGALGLIALNH